jgi:hypothetical protein
VSGSATAPEPGNICDSFNIIIQHFFSGVVLHGMDPSALLKLLDMNKLRTQIKQFDGTILDLDCEEQRKRLQSIGDEMQPITLKEGIKPNEFPALNHFRIPLTVYHIQSIVRDLAKLNKSTTSNILNFSSFNGAHSSLVHVSCSSNYEQFKRNARQFEWFENMMKVAVKGSDVNLAAEWVAKYIGEDYSESFIGAGTNLGLLLQSNVMDAESACAMWEEANVPLRGQRIILRHLANFFGHLLYQNQQ